MPVVEETVLDPESSPIEGARVGVRLAVSSNGSLNTLYGPGGTYLFSATTETDANGHWELDLEPNSNLSPPDSVYEVFVEDPDRVVYPTRRTIQVPDETGPLDVSNLAIATILQPVTVIPGADGEPGPGLEFDWDDTSLGVRVEGDSTYDYVDLQGPAGSVDTHDHDDDYAATSHDHDDDYAATSHDHVEADITDLGSYPDATGALSGRVAETDGAGGWTLIETPTGGAGGEVPSPHALGGTHHSADTLANLNSKVSDATLDDASDPRTPTSHGNEAHDETYIAESSSTDIILREWTDASGTHALHVRKNNQDPTFTTELVTVNDGVDGAVLSLGLNGRIEDASDILMTATSWLNLNVSGGGSAYLDDTGLQLSVGSDTLTIGWSGVPRVNGDPIVTSPIATADLGDNSVTGAKMASGVAVWWFDAGADASAARPASAAATDVVIWTNTPSEPTNLGARDMWEDVD